MNEKLKFKIVEEEIKEILRKYDMAASVTLHRPGISFSFPYLNTTYSCCYQIDDSEFVIKMTEEDIPNVDERIDRITKTSNMLRMIYKNELRTSKFLQLMSVDLDSKSDLIHIDVP